MNGDSRVERSQNRKLFLNKYFVCFLDILIAPQYELFALVGFATNGKMLLGIATREYDEQNSPNDKQETKDTTTGTYAGAHP